MLDMPCYCGTGGDVRQDRRGIGRRKRYARLGIWLDGDVEAGMSNCNVKGIGWLTCEAAVHDQEHASQRLFEKELDDLKFGRRIALLTTGVFIENLVGAK
jgi:hypothetical protein